MTKVIAIANQKGGVGKTSTTVNLGAGLVRQGYDVLLIDLDSQANLTMALGFQNPDDMDFTISNMLHKAVKEEQIDPAEGILTTAEGIGLMPSNVQLSGLELSLINEYGREIVLNWNDVLAVYAVMYMTGDNQVVMIEPSDETERRLSEVFNVMNRVTLTYEIHEEVPEDAPKPTPDPDGNTPEPETVTVLTINVHQYAMTYKEAAQYYGFDDNQMQMLEEMMSPAYYN